MDSRLASGDSWEKGGKSVRFRNRDGEAGLGAKALTDINLRAMVETSLLAGCLNVSGYPPLADAASKDRSKCC